MIIPEFDEYDADDLQELASAVAKEQRRRSDLELIPKIVSEQAKLYSDGGGNVQDLVTAITTDSPVPE